jgi:hypothetical protein
MAGVGLIIALIWAALFLLLACACCLFFCYKCRCVSASNPVWYGEPLYGYRHGQAKTFSTDVSDGYVSRLGALSATMIGHL